MSGFLVFYIFLRPSGFHITWLDGAKALGVFIISGVIGKIIRLKLGKKQLRKTILELKSILQERAEKNKTRLTEKKSTHIN